MPECLVCGCSDFGEPQDGLYFCAECGTQSQDVRVEVSNLDEVDSGCTRSLKQKKERKKKELPGASNEDSHALHTFQRILKQQCDALISLGFDPSIKEAARLIWFIYLRHFGYAFRDQPPPNQGVQGTQSTYPLPSQTQDQADGAALPTKTQGSSGSTPSTCGSIRRKPNPATLRKRLKRDDGAKTAGYDSFPNDDFLFKEAEEENEESETSIARGNPALMMENIHSWEELEAVERNMDCQQLYMFRHGYISNGKPKFVSRGESWKVLRVMVFRRNTTLGVLYLALLYTEQKILPVDIIRWVRLEKIPFNTPIDEAHNSYRGKDHIVPTFYPGLSNTCSVLYSAFQLRQCLPLPPLPGPDPHTVCHIIIERLRLTACFQDLVDKAVDRVYCPTTYKERRIDVQCASVIIMMLRILYGLNDKLEIEHSFYCRAAEGGEEGEEERTSANSLYLWEDWVQLYCDHLNKTMEEGIPINTQEFSKVTNYQTYLQFCKDTVFSKGRPVPVQLLRYDTLDPAFSAKVSQIFHDHNLQQTWKTGDPSTDPTSSTQPHTTTKDTQNTPRLVPLSFFMDSPKVACSAYHPLPPSAYHRDKILQNFSNSMQFLLSVCCELIDASLFELYTNLLIVESAFLKGTFECFKNIAEAMSLEIQ